MIKVPWAYNALFHAHLQAFRETKTGEKCLLDLSMSDIGKLGKIPYLF